MGDFELDFEAKTAINIRFQELFEVECATGLHGYYESMSIAMHGAYGDYLNGRLSPLPQLSRAELEAVRFKARVN